MEVTLIDCMGDDITVCNAARVSMNKETDWEYSSEYCESCNDYHGPYLSDKDKKLIKYLANHGHFTPFTHCIVTLRETVPIFVARQRFKHQIGFTYNEISRRYVDDTPEFFTPKEWRGKPINVKQGSSDIIISPEQYDLNGMYAELIGHASTLYNAMITYGVAPEQARMVLPQSMMTSYYVTGSLSAFARAFKLRVDTHAQKEIQEVAVEWDRIIRPLFPISWSALVD